MSTLNQSVSMEDRLAPCRRPDARPSGWQSWRDLLFVHWDVDPAALRAVVPEELELDLFEGRALVGAVPFAMEKVRPAWLPAAFAFNFLETNLRTYVTHRGEPGVYFFSLEAASWLAVKAARVGWSLPYHHAKMEFTRGTVHDFKTVRRRGGAALSARYLPGGPLPLAEPGSVEFFLLERYILFSQRGRKIMRGQVHHVPYPTQEVQLEELSTSLLEAAGIEALASEPAFVHYSPGVDVEVFGPQVV